MDRTAPAQALSDAHELLRASECRLRTIRPPSPTTLQEFADRVVAIAAGRQCSIRIEGDYNGCWASREAPAIEYRARIDGVGSARGLDPDQVLSELGEQRP